MPKYQTLNFIQTNVNLLKVIVSQSPIAANINTPPCFNMYMGGVLTEEQCPCASPSYNELAFTQAVTIVGYGGAPGQVPGCSGYWIIKNSKGIMWGEFGYGRLCISDKKVDNLLGTCNIQANPVAPDIGLIKRYA